MKFSFVSSIMFYPRECPIFLSAVSNFHAVLKHVMSGGGLPLTCVCESRLENIGSHRGTFPMASWFVRRGRMCSLSSGISTVPGVIVLLF